jgi:hypothetical protein
MPQPLWASCTGEAARHALIDLVDDQLQYVADVVPINIQDLGERAIRVNFSRHYDTTN